MQEGMTPAAAVQERIVTMRSAGRAVAPGCSSQENMMKRNSSFKSQVAWATAIGMLSIGSALAGGDALSTGNVDSMGQWYGRAGGLVGSDRVMALGKASGDSNRVIIAYDKDVAQRTNMQRDSANNGNIGIAYDKDVAARTNMPRDETSGPIKAAGVQGH
jgi:hypothetical protein